MSSLHSIVRRVLLTEAPKLKVKNAARNVAFASFMVKAMPDLYRATDKIARVIDLGSGEPININVSPGDETDFNVTMQQSMQQLVDQLGDPETAAGRRSIQEKLLSALKRIYTSGAEESYRWPMSAMNVMDDREFNSIAFPERVLKGLLTLAARTQTSSRTPEISDDLPDVTAQIRSSGINFPAFAQLVSELDDAYNFFQTSERKSAVHDKINDMRLILVEIANAVLSSDDTDKSRAQVVTLGRRGQRSAGDLTGMPYGLTESMFDLGDDVDLEMDKDVPVTDIPAVEAQRDMEVVSGASLEDDDQDNLPDVDDDTEAFDRISSLRSRVEDVVAFVSDPVEGIPDGDELASRLEEAMDEIAAAAGVSQEISSRF